MIYWVPIYGKKNYEPSVRQLKIFHVNTLRVWENGEHFVDSMLKCMLYAILFYILIQTDNKSALDQVMACHWTGTKPLPDPIHWRIYMYVTSSLFYLHSLTLISTWISNHMPSKVWGEITYPFLNFNGTTIEVYEWISNFIPHFIVDVIHLSMLGLKLNHVSKRGPRPQCFKGRT